MITFTHDGYWGLLELLQENGYEDAFYHDWGGKRKCAILRHDIDFAPERALDIACVEKAVGVKSTYFLLLTTDFYNVFSLQSQRTIDELLLQGHEIGLHFDEMHYPESVGNRDEIWERIIEEADILGRAIGVPIRVVSMHRPSRKILEADLEIPGLVNVYGSMFFKDIKYLSDSRRRWREPAEKIIRSGQYDRLQILVHPFSYTSKETSFEELINHFVNHANFERYDTLEDNITDLASLMTRGEVAGYGGEGW